ncbi:hypothetical protein C8R43DRAFT_961193 [Mycena crocata]|nr:hypothetical protein C8R43DRAFT_961193 [Mycena crocata]
MPAAYKAKNIFPTWLHIDERSHENMECEWTEYCGSGFGICLNRTPGSRSAFTPGQIFPNAFEPRTEKQLFHIDFVVRSSFEFRVQQLLEPNATFKFGVRGKHARTRTEPNFATTIKTKTCSWPPPSAGAFLAISVRQGFVPGSSLDPLRDLNPPQLLPVPPATRLFLISSRRIPQILDRLQGIALGVQRIALSASARSPSTIALPPRQSTQIGGSSTSDHCLTRMLLPGPRALPIRLLRGRVNQGLKMTPTLALDIE